MAAKSAQRIARMKSGELCGGCGSHPPIPGKRTCARCVELIKKWKERNAEHYQKVVKAEHQRNKQQYLDRGDRWMKADPTRQPRKRFQRTLKQYGLTPIEFAAMEKRQSNRCSICGDTPNGDGRLSIDHDHVTGIVRGLLCAKCNAGIGLFRDDKALLYAAISYLDFHKALQPQNGG